MKIDTISELCLFSFMLAAIPVACSPNMKPPYCKDSIPPLVPGAVRFQPAVDGGAIICNPLTCVVVTSKNLFELQLRPQIEKLGGTSAGQCRFIFPSGEEAYMDVYKITVGVKG